METKYNRVNKLNITSFISEPSGARRVPNRRAGTFVCVGEEGMGAINRTIESTFVF